MIFNELTLHGASTNFNTLLDVRLDGALDELNCIKIGIVEEYYPETRTAKVKIAHKACVGVTADGVQVTEDIAPLYPRVVFFGSTTQGINYKVKTGDEVILFFVDHDINGWWQSGQVQQLSSFRTHHASDCIALAGITSQPNTTQTNENLNIYSKDGIINLQGNTTIDGDLIANGNDTINGNLTVNGNISINGTLTVTGDATIGGISFLQHVHSNGNLGADTGVAK